MSNINKIEGGSVLEHQVIINGGDYDGNYAILWKTPLKVNWAKLGDTYVYCYDINENDCVIGAGSTYGSASMDWSEELGKKLFDFEDWLSTPDEHKDISYRHHEHQCFMHFRELFSRFITYPERSKILSELYKESQ